MALVQVIKKSGDIDGKPINWQVLAISGTIDGITQTLELKVNKTEAMLANLLLNSKESLKVTSRKANEDELDNFLNDLPSE